MTSLAAFCDMMEQFLTELIEVFPNEKAFKKAKTATQLLRKTNPRVVMNSYMDCISPYATKLMAKDDTIFTEDAGKIEFLNDLNIASHWTNPETTDGTKAAIWQYLQTLYILGTTIGMLPQETLSMIENVAQQCVSQMGKDGEGGLPDMSALVNLLGKKSQ